MRTSVQKESCVTVGVCLLEHFTLCGWCSLGLQFMWSSAVLDNRVKASCQICLCVIRAWKHEILLKLCDQYGLCEIAVISSVAMAIPQLGVTSIWQAKTVFFKKEFLHPIVFYFAGMGIMRFCFQMFHFCYLQFQSRKWQTLKPVCSQMAFLTLNCINGCVAEPNSKATLATSG